MTGTDKRTAVILIILGVIPVSWLGLLMAPYLNNSLFEAISHLDQVFAEPFHVRIVESSGKSVLLFLLFYFMAIGIYYATRRNYRRGEEHGSAKWGDAGQVNKKYAQRPAESNKLLTQHVRIGLDGRKHRRNLNVLVIGGSGAGKTRFYCKPNLMQANTSFVCLDPKGEMVRDTGHLLKQRGYEVRVLDLIDMERAIAIIPLFIWIRITMCKG